MMETRVDWIPALTILVLGAIFGLVIVWRARGRTGTKPAPSNLDLRDLDARRDAVVQQLRDLEDTAAKRTPEQLARERYALELELARTLRELDREQRKVAAPLPKQEAEAPARSPLWGFLWGAGSMAVIAVLFFFVNTTSSDRTDQPTAMAPSAGGSMEQSHPELAALQRRVQANPDDHAARLDLAQAYLVSNDLMRVFEETQHVLDREPENARALAYQSLVRLAMGQGEIALAMSQAAIRSEPGLIDGWIHRSIVEANLGDMDAATATIREASQRFPQDAPMLEGLLMELENMARAAMARAESSDPNPHDEMSPAAMPDPQREVAPVATTGSSTSTAGSGSVSGILQLDASARGRVRMPAVVYLMARPAGVEAGPPVAVKRIEARSFPMSFTIGAMDSMMGQPLPDQVRLEARIDTDGDAMTREADAPSGALDGIASGSNSVTLVLTAPR